MNATTLILLCALRLGAAGGGAPAAAARVLTLEEAVKTALARQPALRQARAQVAAARARADQAAAPLWPQVSGQATYERTTANFSARPGSVPRQFQAPATSSFETFNFFNLGANGSLLLYDFGQVRGKWHAAESTAEARGNDARAAQIQVVLNVRQAFFGARAARDLAKVAQETFENSQRHLVQVEGFVEVGTRPPIDLAQSRADLANARVQRIDAENGYEQAKAVLAQAMGMEGEPGFEVGSESLPPVSGEDLPLARLLDEAVAARPELASLESQIRAQELTLRALQGSYFPSLGVATGLADTGTAVDKLVWNWNAEATLSWPLYQGGLSRAEVAEAQANLDQLRGQREGLRQQVSLELDQALLAVRAAKAEVESAGEALVNAQERLRLAEGRYQTGTGSIIELDDAQVAASNAGAQAIKAEYGLSTARAQLLKALGRT